MVCCHYRHLGYSLFYQRHCLSYHYPRRQPEANTVGFLRTLKLTISGYAINLITPFGLMGGEPYKIIELQPTLGIQKATSTVLLYMMMHFVSHFIFWMVSIPLLFLIVPNVAVSVRIILAIAGVASLLLLWWSFTVYSKGFVSKALSIAGKLPFAGKSVKAYKQKHIENSADGFSHRRLYKNRKIL